MFNRFEALKYFCIASETLNFRETAARLAVSPPVVTRVIAELEQQLGEALFKRNTRTIQLTHFGETFLPKAKQLLVESDALFKLAKPQSNDEMQGVVRIALPRFNGHEQVLAELLTALEPYPELVIDWRVDIAKVDSVAHRIDIGLRVGREPDPNFIIRHIAYSQAIFVAAPKLIERLGLPTDLDDLKHRYPFTALINPKTNRIWELRLTETELFTPKKIVFISSEMDGEIQAALTGKAVSQLSTLSCAEYLKNGQLQILLPALQLEKWQFYLYRPYQTLTPKRVLVVFDVLERILKGRFGS